MQKIEKKSVVVESDSDSESEQISIQDDDNRLSDDEDFPISEDEVSNEEIETSKKAWAGSISKILNSDKSVVLSKAKKIEDVEKKKEKKSYTFEIDGKQKDKDSDAEVTTEEKIKERKKRKEKRENKIKVFNLRLKPSIADLDRERTFRKIATRGVVQLFNAVKSANANLNKKLETVKIDSKRDEIIKSKETKKDFLDTLMTGPRARSELVDKEVKKEKMEEDSSDNISDDDDEDNNAKKSSWNALRDDFMTGKKVGWDKSDEDEEEENESMESESD
ncbi:hypothetical protein PVAND_010936 [Polypedilum vanderplanki]|uniref:RRP15-like protein n=1 Tax=Polypedilum vanderplanki TaxID=319348 RepID=A0A9J6CIX0_POLVA|nr:hypothetical protein PVAND_010936 [Polypedilum vanderplanki]